MSYNTEQNFVKKNTDYIKYSSIINQIKKLSDTDKSTIIAIDGRCGSGKSYLSSLISEVIECNVFHMDDFFLPFDMRIPERLEEPGGNVHYERFKSEVILPLMNCETVSYHQYLCSKQILSGPITVKYKNLNIIEGVYSLHPSLSDVYDYSIFLTLDLVTQRERIRKRNGEEKLQDFINRWIPLEERYFSSLDIKDRCNLVFDTSELW